MPRRIPPICRLLAGSLCTISCCLTWPVSANEEANSEVWFAGFGSVEITPEAPLFMAGYASRDRPHEGVEAPLRAKALALRDARGNRAVLVTTDLIGLTAEIAEPICDRIIANTGLQRSDILLNSSHTHTGPALTLSRDPTAKMDEAAAGRQAAYTVQLQDAIAQLAIDAIESCNRPVTLSRATGLAPFVMNRREATEDRGIVLGFNPRGPVDRSVPALRIASADEEPELLGVVYQAACHNTTLGGSFYRLTGDFAGYSQAHIEEAHPGAMAMFMTGCAGDANPYPRGELAMSENHGQVLGDEVCRLLAEDEAWASISGPLRTSFTRVELPLEPAPEGKALTKMKLGRGGWRGFVASEIEKRRERGEPIPATYAAPFSTWQFGEDLTLVGMSGEVVVDYVYRLEKELGATDLWISAYCHDVYGYLPSARVLREGGYETRGLYAGGIGFFAPEVEEVVAEAIRRLAKESGRSIPAD